MTSGVILAAGLSSRAGTNKMTYRLLGKAVLEHCMEAMGAVCDEILVVGGRDADHLTELIRPKDKVRLIMNQDFAQGMFSSVRKGLAETAGDRAFIVPGDCPMIPGSVYREMAARHNDIIIPAYAGVPGHPVLLSRKAILALLSSREESLWSFVQSYGYAILNVNHPGILVDLDTEQDLKDASCAYGQVGVPWYTLITGPVDSGKTAMLRQIHKALGRGDGFVITKLFRDQRYIGQQIERLATGETLPFSRREPHVPADFDTCCRLGEYHFSKAGFAYAHSLMDELLAEGVSPLFLDEIGPLELSGGGFAALFARCAASQAEVYAGVRTTCLYGVVQMFGLEDAFSIRQAGALSGIG